MSKPASPGISEEQMAAIVRCMVEAAEASSAGRHEARRLSGAVQAVRAHDAPSDRLVRAVQAYGEGLIQEGVSEMTEDTKSIDTSTPEAPTPGALDQLAVMKAELEANLKAAVDDAIKAGFEAQTACDLLRDLEWLSTSSGHDVETWADIAEAVGALSADATTQQIALAQAKAIVTSVTSKQWRQRQMIEQLPVVREQVAAAAKAYDEKEQAVDKAKAALQDLNPVNKYLKHAAPTVLSSAWLMGMFNKTFKG